MLLGLSCTPRLSNTPNLSHLGTADHIPHSFWVSRCWCLAGGSLQAIPARSWSLHQQPPVWPSLAAAPRLIPALQGLDGAWSSPALGCSTSPGAGHPRAPENCHSPDPTSPGWEETEPGQNPKVFHVRGKKNPSRNQPSFWSFSPLFLTLLIWGFSLKVLLSPLP